MTNNPSWPELGLQKRPQTRTSSPYSFWLRNVADIIAACSSLITQDRGGMPKIVPPGGSKICDPDELKYDHLKAAGSVVGLTKFDEGLVKVWTIYTKIFFR